MSNFSIDHLQQHLKEHHSLEFHHFTHLQTKGQTLVLTMKPNPDSHDDVRIDNHSFVKQCVPVKTIENPLIYEDAQPLSLLSDECRRALAGGTSNPSFVSPIVHEGPVTKHLRLTSALALKNMLKYSDSARKYVL